MQYLRSDNQENSLEAPHVKEHPAGVNVQQFHELTSATLIERMALWGAQYQNSLLAILLTAFAILLLRYTREERELLLRVSLATEPRSTFPPRKRDKAAGRVTQTIQLQFHGGLTVRQALLQVSAALLRSFPADLLSQTCRAADLAHLGINFTWEGGGNTEQGSLSASLHFRESLLTELTSQQLLGLRAPVLQTGNHWQQLLAQLVDADETPLSRLELLGESELHLLRAWREEDLDDEVARPECLHRLFEAQVARNPEHIAVTCAGRELSYGELDRQANQLARHLHACGIGHGSYVAMFLPRSAEVYLTLLAILKTGAAYVPIDPEYPSDRVTYIAQDGAVGALVTTEALAASLPEDIGCPLVLLDRDHIVIAEESTHPLTDTGVAPYDIAYVIYTSGSTGRPKGVQIAHRSACNLVRAEAKLFNVQPSDRVYQGFSIAFDASVEEVWLALYAGATLVVGTHEMVHAGPALARLLTDAGVTVLSCVPTLLSMIDEEIPTLRLLIFGGESCPQDLITRWAKAGRRIVNTYGPTEATVIATCAECHPGEMITIGRPVTNYFVYILDEYGRPVPVGVPGELHIGGIGLSRGYVNKPELTREKFIPNPFAGDAGAPAVLYKTGDLVRFVDDGMIEFLGRIDAQVKLRGFRVELAEIESVLMQCPGVQSACVAVREDQPGIQQLGAYLIPHHGQTLEDAAIRAHLRTRLPAYMLPSFMMTLEAFPTLPSGKVDRKKLPAPARVEAACTDDGGACTDFERKILVVWRELFAPQPVTVHDDFFDLGGHSLLAARMVSSLRKDPCMADVAMLDIYKYPQLKDFAAALGARAGSAPAEHSAARQEAQAEEKAHAVAPPARGAFYACAAGQVAGLYGMMIMGVLALLFAYHIYMGMSDAGHGYSASLFVAMLGATALFPAYLLLAIAAKWLLIGRYQAGSYQVWGWFYWRFWLVRHLQALVPLGYCRNTPLLPLYLRAMGARIGHNVQLGTHHFYIYDLLIIGENSSVGAEALVPGYIVENGLLTLGPVSIGRNCYVGTKCVLHTGVTLHDGACLDELSMAPAGMTLPAGTQWGGSPAQPVSYTVAEFASEDAPVPSGLRKVLFALFYLLSELLLLPLFPLCAGLPAGLLLIGLLTRYGYWSLAALPLLAASFVVLLAAEIALGKRILLGHVTPGRYSVYSGFFLRKWFVDSLMQMGLELLHPLYATLYLPFWFRLLGAKLGKRVEISTVAFITPELLTIDDESFVADSACLGAPQIHRGWLALAATTIGKRTFIGNSALVPNAARIGDESLVGCLSVPPAAAVLREHPNSAWLGSPSVRLPRRQQSEAFADNLIFHPPWYIYLLRGSIEFFRVTLPTSLGLAILVGFFSVLLQLDGLPFWHLVLLLPVVSFSMSLAMVAVVIGLKWLVVGRYRPCVRPLWSSYVWRNEMITALHESFCVPVMVNMFQGTPFVSGYFRAMGARIGKRVLWETTQLTEFDQVQVGDDVTLNLNCTLQTHLFEDRVMKTAKLLVGDGATIGPMAVVLYDSEMQQGASLSGLSLLMKGETLPAWTNWEGIPARRSHV